MVAGTKLVRYECGLVSFILKFLTSVILAKHYLEFKLLGVSFVCALKKRGLESVPLQQPLTVSFTS